MRTPLQAVTALALAVPLLASALPASAASTSLFRDKGAYADVFLQGAGTPGGVPGNYTLGSLSVHSSDLAEGFIDTFTCDAGETPWGDETGEDGCEFVGSYFVWGEGLTVVTGKGKAASSTFSGSVDLYDAMTEEGDMVAQDVPFSFTLTPMRATSKTTFTDSFRDPESGVTYRSRETRIASLAAVQGGLDGVPAVDGVVGTYSVRWMERIA